MTSGFVGQTLYLPSIHVHGRDGLEGEPTTNAQAELFQTQHAVSLHSSMCVHDSVQISTNRSTECLGSPFDCQHDRLACFAHLHQPWCRDLERQDQTRAVAAPIASLLLSMYLL